MRAEGISAVCNGLAWRVDVGLASTESQAGRAGASQILEILTSSACTKDCVSRKRTEDKLRVVGVNKASMGTHRDVALFHIIRRSLQSQHPDKLSCSRGMS